MKELKSKFVCFTACCLLASCAQKSQEEQNQTSSNQTNQTQPSSKASQPNVSLKEAPEAQNANDEAVAKQQAQYFQSTNEIKKFNNTPHVDTNQPIHINH